MSLKRNEISHIGRVGLGLSALFLMLWMVMNRFGLAHSPIESNMDANINIINAANMIGLYINVHLWCKFVTGRVNRFAVLAIALYVVSFEPLHALFGLLGIPFDSFEIVYTTVFPIAIILVYAAIKRQNMLFSALWMIIIAIVTLALQILLLAIHVGSLEVFEVYNSSKLDFISSQAILFDQYLVLAFACAVKSSSRDKREGASDASDFLFPVTVGIPRENDSKKSIQFMVLQAMVISAVCILVGGFFIGASVIISYFAYTSVIKCRWHSKKPVLNMVVYIVVLGTASSIAAFFHYPLLMPVACGFLATYFLYRMGLEHERLTEVEATVYADTYLSDSTCIEKEESEPITEFCEEHFSREELLAFSFDDCNEALLRCLIEKSGINDLYAELIIAKYCENLSGGEMEIRFRNMGVARTRQRHLQQARAEIIEFRDSLIEKQE